MVGTLYYYCLITQSGANCEVVSEVAEIVTNESPDFTMTLIDQEVCLDGSLDALRGYVCKWYGCSELPVVLE